MHIRKTRCIIGLFVQVQARDPGIFGKDSAKISHDVQGDHYMKTLKEFFRKETVFCVSFLLALISAAVVRPDPAYLTYPDYRTLALLFCFMIIVAGFQWLGIFSLLGETLLKKASSLRNLSVLMVLLCFFSSMIITNDVTLITFVPFTILVYQMVGREDRILRIVVLETIAANLGSMATPIGNPQNLYLYSMSGVTLGEFAQAVWPYAGLSLILLVCILFTEKNEALKSIAVKGQKEVQIGKNLFQLLAFAALLLLCLLVVFRVFPYIPVLICVAAAVLAVNRRLFGKVDYFLLLTFLCFFIFIGNMKRIPEISNTLASLVQGKELWAGILTSQIISNVPAAILLSGFAGNFSLLLTAVNLGGLGTLVASLASLISFKFYTVEYPQRKGRFMAVFTVWNLVFLGILICEALILT